MQREYPNKSIEFVRCIAEGNLVALHTHQVWPDNDQYVTMDFFRFDADGKIVEHWDSIQQVPESSKIPIQCINYLLVIFQIVVNVRGSQKWLPFL